MISYIVKENRTIAVKKFEQVDGTTEGLTAGMLLNRDEIVYDIVTNRLSDDDKIYFRDAKEDDLIMEHLGFGMWIRNTYGLWETLVNPSVEENPEPDSSKHPDNFSFEVMELVSQALRGEFTPDVSFVENNFDDAMKIVGGE